MVSGGAEFKEGSSEARENGRKEMPEKGIEIKPAERKERTGLRLKPREKSVKYKKK